MDIEIRHAITYSTKGNVPVRVVAASLLANERLVIDAVRLISDFTPGLAVSSIAVKVGQLSNESPLREVLVASLFVTFQKDLTTEVPELVERLTGHHVTDNMSTLVTVTVVATALYAISSAIDRIMPGKSVRKIIEEYEQKISRVSELSGVDKETIRGYTEARIGPDKSFTRRAFDFFSPAKLEPGTEILLQNGEIVSADAIDELPSQSELELSGDELHGAYELRGVVIDIHRTDRDEIKHGWRAIVETVSDRKVRMVLASDIEPESLYGKRAIVGDILVEEGRLSAGGIGPTTYHLLRIRDGKETG